MLCGQSLPFVDQCVDLGMNTDNKLSFVQRISNFVFKAKARYSFILECFLTTDANTLIKAYTVNVRPLLKYNYNI